MTGHDPLAWIQDGLSGLDDAGLRRRVLDRGVADPAPPLDFSGNDYLGLARDPRLAAAAGDATLRWGSGAGASRLVHGGTPPHHQLEQALAAWKHTDDAVVFSSGYMANLGTVTALTGPGDLVLSDELNHASIVDACRLSRADVAVYRHDDMAHLAQLLRRPARRRLIVTDGVFSMDGDVADLPAICDLAEASGAMVMVDDAHGSGVIGPDGRGTAAAQGVADRVDVHLGTLSKAVGAAGGFVAGSATLVDWLRNTARPFVFDTAPPPGTMAAAAEGVRIAQAEPDRRQRATALARRLAAGLDLPEPAACVVPLVVGAPDAAVALSVSLAVEGFSVVAIRPPSVPQGTARLRFTTHAGHDEDDVDVLVDAVRRHWSVGSSERTDLGPVRR